MDGRLVSCLLLSALAHLGLLNAPASPAGGSPGADGVRAGAAALRVVLRPAARAGLEKAAVFRREPEPAPRAGTGSGRLAYVPLHRLSTPPRPLEHIDLDLPELDAYASAGRVELILRIAVDGSVTEVGLAPSMASAHSGRFVAMLADRFRRARFTPAELNGRRVAAEVPVTVVVEAR